MQQKKTQQNTLPQEGCIIIMQTTFGFIFLVLFWFMYYFSCNLSYSLSYSLKGHTIYQFSGK